MSATDPSVSQYASSPEFRKTEELAKAAFALQELRYLAWVALKAFDAVSLRKAQHAALDGPMEALRAVLPTEVLDA